MRESREPEALRMGRLRALGEIIAVIVAFIGASLAIGPLLGVPLAAICLYAGVLAAWGLLRLSGQSWRAIGLRSAKAGNPVAATAIGTAVVGLLLFLCVIALEAVGLPPIDLSALGDAVEGDAFMFVVTLVVVVWGSAAFAEELLFRGFVLNRLEHVFHGAPGSTALAVLGQALLFAMAHSYQGVTGLLYSGSIGALFGWVYLRCERNLWVPILAHGTINTVGVTLLFFGWL